MPRNLGAVPLFAAGLPVAPVFVSAALGVLLYSAGAFLFAVRGHLDPGDKAAAGARFWSPCAPTGSLAFMAQ